DGAEPPHAHGAGTPFRACRRQAGDARGGRLQPRHHAGARPAAGGSGPARAARCRARSRAVSAHRIGSVGSMSPGFVDVHSHVCPSGDDGARTVEQGRELCRSAAQHGTRILFATPHVWPHLPLDPERERGIRDAFSRLAPQAGVELRLGFELTPSTRLLEDDLRRYELQGTGAVLIEIPFVGSANLFFRVCEEAQAQGLRVIAAHPERTESVLEAPDIAAEIAARGWLVQVNGSSLTGWDGPEIEALAC